MSTAASRRVKIVTLLVASLLPYLKWGGGHTAFLGQIEYQLLFDQGLQWDALLHPMVMLPLAGQVLLLATLAQRLPNWWLATVALLPVTLLISLVAIGAVLTRNIESMVSVMPFAAGVAWHLRDRPRASRA